MPKPQILLSPEAQKVLFRILKLRFVKIKMDPYSNRWKLYTLDKDGNSETLSTGKTREEAILNYKL